MCGILALLGLEHCDEEMICKALKLSKKIRHRGGEEHGLYNDDKNILVHERLSIVGVKNGKQPIEDENLVLIANGEIYNHEELRKTLGYRKYKTNSDCEVLMHAYEKYGINFLEKCNINGMFGFVLYDKRNNFYIIARDPIGIIPLYIGYNNDKSIYICSELKGLEGECDKYEEFPPGIYYVGNSMDSSKNFFKHYFNEKWFSDINYIPKNIVKTEKIKEALIKAVERHMVCDDSVEMAVLLSGGLDSSLIASIASRLYKKKYPNKRLKSYCIGLKNSPDLKAAKDVAEFIGTDHTSFEFTVDDGVNSLSNIIYHLETFDVTTIRASTPMYLLCKKIKSDGVKMILSGEGADEMFGGYLYFHKAPNGDEFHKETVRKLKELSKLDCLRTNKSAMASGIEPRVPFLDIEFLNLVMNMNPKMKMCINGIEKYILRKSFDDTENLFLPKEVLWRQKEQFSDGVGYNWIDSLKEISDKKISFAQMKLSCFRFPVGTPKTKEGYMFREIFHSHFNSKSAINTVKIGDTIACSSNIAINWDESFNVLDPSGRSIKDIHSS